MKLLKNGSVVLMILALGLFSASCAQLQPVWDDITQPNGYQKLIRQEIEEPVIIAVGTPSPIERPTAPPNLPDFSEEHEALIQQAVSGELEAQLGLTRLYHDLAHDYESDKDLMEYYDQEAIFWYYKAALQGSGEGLTGLGNWLNFIKNQQEEALYWLYQAAEAGFVNAYWNIAVIHAPKTQRLALSWIMKGVEQNSETAIWILARSYLNGYTFKFQRNRVAAYALFKLTYEVTGSEYNLEEAEEVAAQLSPEALVEAEALLEQLKAGNWDALP